MNRLFFKCGGINSYFLHCPIVLFPLAWHIHALLHKDDLFLICSTTSTNVYYMKVLKK